MISMARSRKLLTAVDLFSGAGGATEGLQHAGFTVLGAVENERHAVSTYAANHAGTILEPGDIRDIDADAFRRSLGIRKRALTLLKACPPCQGYSSLHPRGKDDPRNDLIMEVVRFVKAFEPRVVLVENVPRLRVDTRLIRFVRSLQSHGYSCRDFILDARDFGVPQRRRRYILLAARGRSAHKLPEDPREFLHHFKADGPSLRSIFEHAAKLRQDPLQIVRLHSATVRRRIAAVPINGDRRDLPHHLEVPCHRGKRSEATASYGRIRIDGFAPTMTTRCTSPSCGSFVHPNENRAINLREASLIQTFPDDYRFVGSYVNIERMIGNAVPVRMAQGLGYLVSQMV